MTDYDIVASPIKVTVCPREPVGPGWKAVMEQRQSLLTFQLNQIVEEWLKDRRKEMALEEAQKEIARDLPHDTNIVLRRVPLGDFSTTAIATEPGEITVAKFRRGIEIRSTRQLVITPISHRGIYIEIERA